MLINELNKEISKRTTYGIRKEIAQKAGYVLSWNNADAAWNRAYYQTKKNEELSLDANQVFAVGTKAQIDEALPHLNKLPLYSNSFEVIFNPAQFN